MATLVMGAIGLIGVALNFLDLIRRRTLLPLLIAISGAFIAIPEMFIDVMGAVYYPWSPDVVVYKILGREMPWWIVAGWFGFGAFGYVIFRVIASNLTTKSHWLTWFGAALENDQARLLR